MTKLKKINVESKSSTTQVAVKKADEIKQAVQQKQDDADDACPFC